MQCWSYESRMSSLMLAKSRLITTSRSRSCLCNPKKYARLLFQNADNSLLLQDAMLQSSMRVQSGVSCVSSCGFGAVMVLAV
mmetsp:Transcript_26149/g.38955  ORF Transcript_26149/g.38955 Transcript_26149/m.38955 type:complete len:82 (-) Transcript_26149:111-356(-)